MAINRIENCENILKIFTLKKNNLTLRLFFLLYILFYILDLVYTIPQCLETTRQLQLHSHVSFRQDFDHRRFLRKVRRGRDGYIYRPISDFTHTHANIL